MMDCSGLLIVVPPGERYHIYTDGTVKDGRGTASCDIDLELDKVIDFTRTDFELGLVAYRLTLRNSDDAVATAFLAEVADLLPSGATVSSSDAPPGTSFDESSATWSVPMLEVGQEFEMELVLHFEDGLISRLVDKYEPAMRKSVEEYVAAYSESLGIQVNPIHR